MKKITLLLLALILAACSAGGSELSRNQSKWQDANVTHYRFQLSVGCFCLFRSQMPLTVEVKDSEVVSMIDVNGEAFPMDDPMSELVVKHATIDRLFISKETRIPCIINMSFGIGSELETLADMELFIENLAKENPYLYISLSAGNEGPGISSVGLPSSNSGTFCSGAILPQDVGRDLYSATLNRDIILNFSSRGGEVNKPDVCSPGASTSTVPNWTGWDRFWGTSMAAPYTAGVMSLVLSTADKEYPGVKIPSQLLYKAIRESATKMEGYNHLDQGHGYINAVNAYELLKKYIDDGEINKFETYSISSTSPNSPFEKAPRRPWAPARSGGRTRPPPSPRRGSLGRRRRPACRPR